MITKEEAQEMAVAEGLQNYYNYSGLVNAAYKRGVEDTINKTVELGAIDRDGVFADEIRDLL